MNHEHHAHHESDKHAGHSLQMFRDRFITSAILSIPVILYSELPERFFGWQAPVFPGSDYLPLILSSIVFFYGGLVFLQGAWQELRKRLPGMMALIALAISAAYIWSIYAVFSGTEGTLFWELSTLITVMLLGHWFEMRAVQGARGALHELSKLLPDTAELILGTSDAQEIKTKTIPLSELKIDDLVFVRPGSKIPADGLVIDGQSEVNESMITGESKPVRKSPGTEVIAGTVNADGALKIKVTKIGENTFLSGVMRLVAEAQASKSRLQILGDRAAYYLTVIAIFSGIITLVLWLVAKAEVSFAVERLVAVLVIACPHALGLAIPLVAAMSTAIAAHNGFLVRQRLALETARNIDIVLFDKTGTLTRGEYGVTEILANKELEVTADGILKLAASVDSHSEHFISKAIVKAAEDKRLELLSISDFRRIPGKGVQGTIDGKTTLVGGEAILEEAKVKLPEELKSQISGLAKQGKTIIYVVEDSRLLGVIALADVIREESKEAIDNLKEMNVKTAMITGDSKDVASWVAKELGIDEYFAKVLPQEKAEKVKVLQSRGLKVSMVGDGINDAPALTQADLGVAIGAGTNVAIESAGIILVKNDPRDIVKIIKLSRLTYRKMIQNLFWATGYNVVALPLAAGALAFKGILLQPALAAVFMSLSTVIVAINAILLKRAKVG